MFPLIAFSLFVVSGVLLQRTVRAFRAAWRHAEIARVPAVPVQTIRFSEAGASALFLEGPRYRTYNQHVRFTLHDSRSGLAVPVEGVRMGSRVRSRRRSRVQRGRLVLPHAGIFELRVEGLPPDRLADYEIVIMPPMTGRLIRFILSCVFLGIALIGSLVLGILSLVS